MSQYLVTGGAGFIGSHLVKELVNHGHEVTVLDNVSTGRQAALEGYLDKIRFIEGDVRDYQTVVAAGRQAEYIFHLAALMSVSQSMIDPVPTFEVNGIGTLNILKLAREEHVKRLIFSSSCAVYGDANNTALKETDIVEPVSGYGLSKLGGERYCKLFSRTYDIPTVCLRYFNVFGPGQVVKTNYGAVIPQFITTLLAGKTPTVYGTGEQTRDFIYIQDIVTANLAAANLSPAVQTVTLNVAQGKPVSVNTLLKELEALIPGEVRPKYAPWRTGEVLHSVAAIDEAKKVLGFEAKVTLEEGLRQTVEWYKSH